MFSRVALSVLALSASIPFANALSHKRSDYLAICQEIEQAVSSGTKVSYAGEPEYIQDNLHFFPSSSEVSACTVEPATAEDIGKVVTIASGAGMPFGVKSGGHAINQKHSSSEGVLISMTHFRGKVYDAEAQTAYVGTGQLWEDVYAYLEPYNVSVVGMRVPDIGVGGFTLGGGYAFQTSERGLGFDTLISFEMVLPNGQIVNVTETEYTDLLWAAKGGVSNLGIVTNFLLRTFPQSAVWGGNLQVVGQDAIDLVSAATTKMSLTCTDNKVAMNVILVQMPDTGLTALVNLFYNAPEPPAGIFDDFLAVPHVSSTIGTRSLLTMVTEIQFPHAPRGMWDHVPVVSYPKELNTKFLEESNAMFKLLNGTTSMSHIFYLWEFFTPDFLKHAPALPGFPTPSAYPPQRDTALMGSLIWIGWSSEDDDELIHGAIKDSNLLLRKYAASLGQEAADPDSPLASKYPNYSAYWTPAEEIFGANLPLLREIKAKYDPTNVMGLTGGFKV